MPAVRIELEGAWNFRDFGGVTAADGRRIRPGAVFRSDALHRLTAGDAARLEALGLSRVYDLRSARELETDGLGDFAAVGDRHFHRPLVRVTLSPFDPSIDWKTLDLSSRYLEMLREGGAVVVEILSWLASAEAGPTVFHCTAGKDRTGVLAALLLLALGVDEEEVVADYAASEVCLAELLSERRKPLLAMGLDLEAVAYLTTAPASRMKATLLRLEADWGGVEGYLACAGAAPGLSAALRARLLV
jgi:protein-tyrosine phosphatase